MTKQDYIIIASIIRKFFLADIHDHTMRCNLKASQILVDMFCESLSQDNPQFEPETFRQYISLIEKD